MNSDNQESMQTEDVKFDPDMKCIVCCSGFTEGHFICPGCSDAGKPAPIYCGRKHQEEHWESGHDLTCGATTDPGWAQVQDSSFNEGIPYFVATRDLKPGVVLFKKSPLLAFPRLPTSDMCAIVKKRFENTLPDHVETYTCLSCYEVVLYGQLIHNPDLGLTLGKCKNCEWPLHSSFLPDQPPTYCDMIHAKECVALKDGALSWRNLEQKEKGAIAYNFIGLLRALLLSPEERDILMKLPITFQRENCTPDLTELTKDMMHLLDTTSFSKLSFGDINKIMIQIFSNRLYLPFRNHPRTNLGYIIYNDGPTGRILPHSCLPNTTIKLDECTTTGTYKLLRHVKKGEPLTISYLLDHHLPNDQRLFQYLSFFTSCKCLRCSGATEGETHFSTLVCQCGVDGSDSKGLMLPLDPVSSKCRCKKCGHTLDKKDVDKLIEKIKVETNMCCSKGDFNGLQVVLERYSGNLVHEGHWTMHFIQIQLANIAMKLVMYVDQYQESEPVYDQHTKYLACFDKILQQLDKIQPGRTFYRGVFLFMRCLMKMSELAENISKQMKFNLESLKEYDQQLGHFTEELKESWGIIQDDSYFESHEIEHYKSLRILYSNHLIMTIVKKIGKNYASHFTNLPDFAQYADATFMLNIYALMKPEWEMIDESCIPKLTRLLLSGKKT